MVKLIDKMQIKKKELNRKTDATDLRKSVTFTKRGNEKKIGMADLVGNDKVELIKYTDDIYDDIKEIGSKISDFKVSQDKLADFGGNDKAAKIQKIKKSSHILKEHLTLLEAYRNDQLGFLKTFRDQLVGSMEIFSKFEKGKVILTKDIKNYHTMLKLNVKCLLLIDKIVDDLHDMVENQENKYIAGGMDIQKIKASLVDIERWTKEYD